MDRSQSVRKGSICRELNSGLSVITFWNNGDKYSKNKVQSNGQVIPVINETKPLMVFNKLNLALEMY
jgi:hypothetical protein